MATARNIADWWRSSNVKVYMLVYYKHIYYSDFDLSGNGPEYGGGRSFCDFDSHLEIYMVSQPRRP